MALVMPEPEASLALAVVETVVVDLACDCRCGQTDHYGRPLRCHHHDAVADVVRAEGLDPWCGVLGYDAPMRAALYDRLTLAARDRAVARRMLAGLSVSAPPSSAHVTDGDAGRADTEVA